MNDTKQILVAHWKLGMKFTCESCGVGKFTADKPNPQCPKCGQKHVVKVGL